MQVLLGLAALLGYAIYRSFFVPGADNAPPRRSR